MSDTKQQDNNIDFFCKIINPYEFIHNKVPGSKFSVSKIKASSPLFYTFMEIAHTFSIFDSFQNKDITSFHCSMHNSATIECMNIFRDNNSDTNYEWSDLSSLQQIDMTPASVDFLYYELQHDDTDIDAYGLDFTRVLCSILTLQNTQGISIIKIDTLFHKPILDIVYLLTGIYEKVYIIKPNTSTVFKNERFIVCKHFIRDSFKTTEYYSMINLLNAIIIDSVANNKCIYSLIYGDLPYYFLNKIEDANIIIGHLQLEQYDQLINLIKNKNSLGKLKIYFTIV
jgi:hypothetical protein